MSTFSSNFERKGIPSYRCRLLCLAIGILLVICLFLMRIQNTTHVVGGHIALPKALWLHWTVTTFYVVPFFLWRSSVLNHQVQSLFGWLLLCFVARGVIELIIIYSTHDWRCIYGISHNVFTFALGGILLLRLSGNFSSSDRWALLFNFIYIATLGFETLNAWQFSLLANPANGVYFAANTPHFSFVNKLTWAELGCLWPCLTVYLWKLRI